MKRHFRGFWRELPPFKKANWCTLERASARILHQNVVSSVNVPAYTNSGVDGYALHAADIAEDGSARLLIKDTALAGQSYRCGIVRGECLRIMTGAAVPEPLDTVVMQEHVEIEDGYIKLNYRYKAGKNVRHVGEDIKIGENSSGSRSPLDSA
jgi:molybdopterin molybdotransferase